MNPQLLPELLDLYNQVWLLFRDEGLFNRINVFPVADADTGTNMLLTAEGLIADVDTSSLNGFLNHLSYKALISARGNSGTILASFVTGLIEHVQKSDFRISR